jgi:hypothetical protein
MTLRAAQPPPRSFDSGTTKRAATIRDRAPRVQRGRSSCRLPRRRLRDVVPPILTTGLNPSTYPPAMFCLNQALKNSRQHSRRISPRHLAHLHFCHLRTTAWKLFGHPKSRHNTLTITGKMQFYEASTISISTATAMAGGGGNGMMYIASNDLDRYFGRPDQKMPSSPAASAGHFMFKK